MKPFAIHTEVCKRSAPAKPSKRFVACIIDLLLVAILAEVLFLGLFRIAQNTAAYRNAQATVDDEISYYEQLTDETHIVEYVDGRRVATDVTVLKNLYRAICLSYQVFGNEQQPDFTFAPDHDVTVNGIHSTESDNVAYFYTHYLAEHPEIGIEVNTDLFEIYKRSFGNDAAFMFTFNRDVSAVPVLKTSVAYYLFHYLFVDASDSIGQTGATYYQTYHYAYANMLEEAEMLILQSEPYHSTRYQRYKEAYSAEARYTNMALVLSIVIACFAVLLLPVYLLGFERTVGYALLGIGVLRTDGEPNRWYVPLLKTAIFSLGAIPIAFILYLFPPFSGSYEAMFMPVSVNCGISLAMVILIALTVGGIVNAFSFFTDKKQNLLNMIFGDIVFDIHFANESEHEERNHGRDY